MMEQTIIKYIEKELANEYIEDGLDATDDLLGSGILDSMAMVRLIAYVEETFEIKVDPEEMIIENFMTVEDISNFISSKKV
ncbi:acyl carrier protein [Hyunsoonleella sp. SJ7]|uniref:Acyl carrier protein n=1 Tax=Hyunsoonleella aquatilis TaxID=2762758 RepID=A0A923HIS4_9FLAO|nr:acyl carrier protein [Hyunsoonleella aquatilis]MBC3759107.1 acyl carrier protein [Hyunsoonleella aquatilis]